MNIPKSVDEANTHALLTAQGIVERTIRNAWHVVPTNNLINTKYPVPASFLTVGKEGHFLRKELTAKVKKVLCQQISEGCKDVMERISCCLHPFVDKCAGKIAMLYFNKLQGNVYSEMELQFAICDPIITMMCRVWNLRVSFPMFALP